MVTDNVATLMQEKLDRAPPLVHQILPLAACLGSSFQADVLDFIWRGLDSHDDTSTDRLSVLDMLRVCEEEGFIEQQANGASSSSLNINEYTFVHDKVQEASLGLLEQGDLNDLKY